LNKKETFLNLIFVQKNKSERSNDEYEENRQNILLNDYGVSYEIDLHHVDQLEIQLTDEATIFSNSFLSKTKYKSETNELYIDQNDQEVF
jgi:hypothetical protein